MAAAVPDYTRTATTVKITPAPPQADPAQPGCAGMGYNRRDPAGTLEPTGPLTQRCGEQRRAYVRNRQSPFPGIPLYSTARCRSSLLLVRAAVKATPRRSDGALRLVPDWRNIQRPPSGGVSSRLSRRPCQVASGGRRLVTPYGSLSKR